jgi:NADH dehydrogenase FAD-containing subunit
MSDDAESLPVLPAVPGTPRRARKLVLVGAEPVHLHLLAELRKKPLKGIELTLIAPTPQAAWPDLLPPVLAGLTPKKEAHVDLAGAANRAGAELIIDQVVGCDLETKTLQLAVHDERAFDVVSLNLSPANVREDLCRTHRTLVGLHPRATFLARFESRLAELVQQFRDARNSEPMQFTVVGNDAFALEFAFCLTERARRENWSADVAVINDRAELLPGWSDGTIRRAIKLCQRRGIRLHLGSPVMECDEDGASALVLANGERIRVDLAIWAAGAAPPGLLHGYPLPVTSDGRVEVDETLQSTADLPFFAAGEICGGLDVNNRPANLEAAALADNLCDWFRREPLAAVPEAAAGARFLTCGDGTAIGEYRGWSWQSAVCWRWKLQRIQHARQRIGH